MTEKAKMLNGELYDSSDKQLVDELKRDDFLYVVPDFRLNKVQQLENLLQKDKDKVEFLCNECCFIGCLERNNSIHYKETQPYLYTPVEMYLTCQKFYSNENQALHNKNHLFLILLKIH